MFRNSTYIILILILFTSCFKGGKEAEKSRDKKYGGKLVVDFPRNFLDFKNEIETFKPNRCSESIYVQSLRSVFEALTRVSPNTCSVEPSLAKSWKSKNDETKFIFSLRTDVLFCKGKLSKETKMTAYDVKVCFDDLSTCINKSVAYTKIKDLIRGVKSYNESCLEGIPDPKGVSGIIVLNDSTIQFDLLKSYSPFPELLSNIDFSIYKKDSNELTKMLTTGPFMVDKITEKELFLVKNENYWKFDEQGNRLPYIDSLVFKQSESQDVETKLNSFIKNELHVLKGISADDVSVVMKVLKEENDIDFRYESIDAAQFFGIALNNLVPPFNNVKVRKAFNYAFDRDLYIDSVRNGEGWPVDFGFAPPQVSSYQDTIKGLLFDLNKAKGILAEAGYPNGKGFPEVVLSVVERPDGASGKVTSSREKTVIEMICKNLNIKFKFKKYSSFLSMYRDKWKGRFMASSFLYSARYSSPESYLRVLNIKPDTNLGVEHDNAPFFNDSIFDSFYNKALKEADEEKRNKLFFKAEKRVVELAPFISISYGETSRISSKNIVGISDINNLGILDLTKAYFFKK